jgi:hypothetical protein
MALSDAQVRAAKPRDKNYKLYDADGLFVLVTIAGGKLWRFKYRFAGKEKVMTLGKYPRVGLQEARRKRNAAREMLDELLDPGAEKAAKKQAVRTAASNTFELVAREWHAAQVHRWSDLYAEQVLKRFETEVFPDLGHRPISAIDQSRRSSPRKCWPRSRRSSNVE